MSLACCNNENGPYLEKIKDDGGNKVFRACSLFYSLILRVFHRQAALGIKMEKQRTIFSSNCGHASHKM